MEKETRVADVVIIGGGASGLAAAIELGIKAPALDVLVIEKLAEPGRKIRATGSGRCNITNTEAAGFSRHKAQKIVTYEKIALIKPEGNMDAVPSIFDSDEE